MPELPDVEIFKQYLTSTALHQKIDDIDIRDAALLKGVSPARLKSTLTGTRFAAASRHGKHLFVNTDNDQWLMFHFGMTGYLKYFKHTDKEPDHPRLVFDFTNGYHLAYDCQRKLGRISLIKDPQTYVEKQDLGPDALGDTLSSDHLAEIMDKSRASVKSLLMDQSKIAGIGNVYSDEILFQAGIDPRTKSGELDRKSKRQLYGAMKTVLEKSIKAGAEPARLPDSFLIPQRHKGGKCPGCQGTVERLTISGRSAYFCPACQNNKA